MFHPNGRQTHKSLVMSGDLDTDPRVNDAFRLICKGRVRGYMSIKIRLDYDQIGTLLVMSSQPRKMITAEDMSVMHDVAGAIEDFYAARRAARFKNTMELYSMQYSLISCIRFALDRYEQLPAQLTKQYIPIKTDYHLHRRRNTSKKPESSNEKYFATSINKLEKFCNTEMWTGYRMLLESIERVIFIAESLVVQEDSSILKEVRTAGVITTLNEELSQFYDALPDSTLLWFFRIDGLLAQAPHQLSYQHLMLFLELILHEFSTFSSATHITISLRPVRMLKFTEDAAVDGIDTAMEAVLEVQLESVDEWPESCRGKDNRLEEIISFFGCDTLEGFRVRETPLYSQNMHVRLTDSPTYGHDHCSYIIDIPIVFMVDEKTKQSYINPAIKNGMSSSGSIRKSSRKPFIPVPQGSFKEDDLESIRKALPPNVNTAMSFHAGALKRQRGTTKTTSGLLSRLAGFFRVNAGSHHDGLNDSTYFSAIYRGGTGGILRINFMPQMKVFPFNGGNG